MVKDNNKSERKKKYTRYVPHFTAPRVPCRGLNHLRDDGPATQDSNLGPSIRIGFVLPTPSNRRTSFHRSIGYNYPFASANRLHLYMLDDHTHTKTTITGNFLWIVVGHSLGRGGVRNVTICYETLRQMTICYDMWDMLRYVTICGNMRRYVTTCYDMWDMLRYVTICGICDDMWRHVMICGICEDMWGYVRICEDMWQYAGICSTCYDTRRHVMICDYNIHMWRYVIHLYQCEHSCIPQQMGSTMTVLHSGYSLVKRL